MKTTWKDLKRFAEKVGIPDDAEIWIEYPEQLAQPEVRKHLEIKSGSHVVEDFDVIESMSHAYFKKENIFVIQHHY